MCFTAVRPSAPVKLPCVARGPTSGLGDVMSQGVNRTPMLALRATVIAGTPGEAVPLARPAHRRMKLLHVPLIVSALLLGAGGCSAYDPPVEGDHTSEKYQADVEKCVLPRLRRSASRTRPLPEGGSFPRSRDRQPFAPRSGRAWRARATRCGRRAIKLPQVPLSANSILLPLMTWRARSRIGGAKHADRSATSPRRCARCDDTDRSVAHEAYVSPVRGVMRIPLTVSSDQNRCSARCLGSAS